MSSIYDLKLKRDHDGRIVEKMETVKGKLFNWIYQYDKEGRLKEALINGRMVCRCHYDKEGRRSQDQFPMTSGAWIRQYEYQMDNRLRRAGDNSYTHDKSGFRYIWNNRGKYTTYKYAKDYRLLEVHDESEEIRFTFDHDEHGQRMMKYANGAVVEAYKWLDFVRLSGFYDGNVRYYFIYEDEARVPHAMQREDGKEYSLYYDQVGSLRVVGDSKDNVMKEVIYDPFGGIIEDSNPDFRIPIGFAGGLHDLDLGFVRFGWRDYDTLTGRWTAPDPMGDAGGDPDWYGYCLDDPVNAVDPLGLFLFGGVGLAGLSAAVMGAMRFAPIAARSFRRYGKQTIRAVKKAGEKVNREINVYGPEVSRYGGAVLNEIDHSGPSYSDVIEWGYEKLSATKNKLQHQYEAKKRMEKKKQALADSIQRTLEKKSADKADARAREIEDRKMKSRNQELDKKAKDAKGGGNKGYSGPTSNIGRRGGSYGGTGDVNGNSGYGR